MTLFETVYKAGKTYWHASPDLFKKFESKADYNKDQSLNEVKAVFLAPDIGFAAGFYMYLRKKAGKEFDHIYEKSKKTIKDNKMCLYQCELKKNLNLFKFSNKADFKKVYERIKADINFVKNYSKKIPGIEGGSPHFKKLIKKAKTLNELLMTMAGSADLWLLIENPAFVAEINRAGFDGYISEESLNENLAIFDPSNIEIKKTYFLSTFYVLDDHQKTFNKDGYDNTDYLGKKCDGNSYVLTDDKYNEIKLDPKIAKRTGGLEKAQKKWDKTKKWMSEFLDE